VAPLRASLTKRFWWAVHNVVAHPLMVVWPWLGEMVHDWTGKRM